ncbi:M20/M25/M40 family metallo-hydrolase [Naasia lichenicola]|uniref:M20/M25/M40 family metallo-hydrolase n=1 Tax=Naasia lichenicola TaxID=2565933 RepID=A0A4S4FQ68_9MICO|nr:M20/M25/M40 family metallo-hydrolase [Naasia lichenicola]
MTADEDAAVERFRQLLRIPTVSKLDRDATDWAAFDAFVVALPALYPALHASLERETVDGHSLLYRWPGREGATSTTPTVLMAHYDVVAASDEGWQHPPFAAELIDGVIHARGAIDDKGALVAILEAVERLATAGFQPEHDVLLSFGHDEETAGTGARAIVELLRSRGIRPALVLDEGGAVVEPGLVKGVDRSLAVIGVTEKGITSLRLTVDEAGGHASTPPKLTATARLARAITRLTRSPFPARLNAASAGFIGVLGANSGGPQGWLLRNLRYTKPLVLVLFSALGNETRAMVRTTAAVTELHGSDGANVLAEQASAIVNIRIGIGSSVASVLRHVRRAIRDDGVRIEVLHPSEPSPISPSTGPAWEAISAALATVYPESIATPYTMLAASDARHFTAISDHVYRFTPFELHAADRATLHARNERIRVVNWLRGIDFYETLLSSR